MMEDYHIDLSVRLFDEGATGIACVGAETKKHNGCVLSRKLKKDIDKHICSLTSSKNRAMIYAICIYYLIRNNLENVKRLIICNDENFVYTREYLHHLLNDENYSFKIISITEFQKILGRNVKSLADNYARQYRKRGLSEHRWNKGHRLDVAKINFRMIKNKYVSDK